jgi:hypothetical protein
MCDDAMFKTRPPPSATHRHHESTVHQDTKVVLFEGITQATMCSLECCLRARQGPHPQTNKGVLLSHPAYLIVSIVTDGRSKAKRGPSS